VEEGDLNFSVDARAVSNLPIEVIVVIWGGDVEVETADLHRSCRVPRTE